MTLSIYRYRVKIWYFKTLKKGEETDSDTVQNHHDQARFPITWSDLDNPSPQSLSFHLLCAKHNWHREQNPLLGMILPPPFFSVGTVLFQVEKPFDSSRQFILLFILAIQFSLSCLTIKPLSRKYTDHSVNLWLKKECVCKHKKNKTTMRSICYR